MSTALAQTTSKPSALRTMALRLNVEPEALFNTLKQTVCKGCSDSEMMAFSIVANEYGLNPFIKHIYAFPAKGGGIVPVVSVDGWITMANNHPQMDGIEFEDEHDEKGNLIAIACTIYRKDRTRSIKTKEYLDECKRPTDPWKMPHRMLRHKALIQTCRIAFGFSGVYDEDEAADIARNGGMRDTTGRVVETSEPTGNPFNDPRFATDTEAKPEAKAAKKPAKETAAQVEAPEEVTADNADMTDSPAHPSKEDMIADIREACTERNVEWAEAARRYRMAGAIPKGKKFADLTDDEIAVVWNARGTALDEQAPKEGATA